jgi:hypothetical protein
MRIRLGPSSFIIWGDNDYVVNFARLNRSVAITAAVLSEA